MSTGAKYELRPAFRDTVMQRFLSIYKKQKRPKERQLDFFERYNGELGSLEDAPIACTDEPISTRYKNAKGQITKSTYGKFVQQHMAVMEATACRLLIALRFSLHEIEQMIWTTDERNSAARDGAIHGKQNAAPLPDGRTICTDETKTGEPGPRWADATNRPRDPKPFYGRRPDIRRVKQMLGVTAGSRTIDPGLVAVYGTPGIGKSTLAAALANDPQVHAAFPDAVLWVVFGLINHNDSRSEVRDRLQCLYRHLGLSSVGSVSSVDDAVTDIGQRLVGRRALLICDDVWSVADFAPLRRLAEGGIRIALTSRLGSVAESIALTPKGVTELQKLDTEDALKILKYLEPSLVGEHRDLMIQVVNDLDCNPLAVDSAGRLLRKQMRTGLDVEDLVPRIRDEILGEELPTYMMELAHEARSRTIAAWLMRSVNNLSPDARKCFIKLGKIADKPGIFRRSMLMNAWSMYRPDAVLRELVGNGLLRRAGDDTYHMHALLVTLATNLK